MRRAGQTAYEFLFMFFFFTAIFTVWMVFTTQAKDRIVEEQAELSLDDLGMRLQDELYTAVRMPDGFSRTLTLPATIAGQPYTAEVYEASDVAAYLDIDNGRYTKSFAIPTLRTPHKPYQLNKTIIINKTGGELYLANNVTQP